METQQTLTGASVRIGGRKVISRLYSSVESPNVTLAGTTLPLLRLFFAVSVVVMVNRAGVLSGPQPEILWVLALGYLFYSAALCAGIQARLKVAKSAIHYSAWVDLCWFAFLVFLTTDTNPVLFGGFWLAVLAAYDNHSRHIGLTVTFLAAIIIATDLFFNLGSMSVALGVHHKLAETVSLICAPLILGTLASYWARQRATLKSRIALLLDVSDFSNPRFGAEWCLNTLMEKVRAFYKADGCLFIEFLEGDSSYRIHHKSLAGSGAGVQTETISQEFARQLLVVPETHAFILSPSGIPVLRPRYIEYDVLNKQRSTNVLSVIESLSILLEAESIISVPVFLQAKVTGRIFLSSNKKRFFCVDDCAFLCETSRQYLRLMENLRLVDNLKTSASDIERKHIALDMHDNVVQPYIGIQLGLGAIQRKVQAGRMDISEDLEKLTAMAQTEISGLRHYMLDLSPEVKHKGQFLPAVQRLTEKFAASTGIAVDVKTSKDIELNDKLAAEAFQMIAEGLSNIRRHTAATEASIEIHCNKTNFHLRISNNGRSGNGTKGEFVPKSITSRAASLGGAVHIDLNAYGKTVLNIGIPF